MKRQILAYGNPILQRECHKITAEYPNITSLIEEMWEIMNGANGCGLSAPQIGINKKLFIVDSKTTFDLLDEKHRKIYFDENDNGIMESFVNATIMERSKETWEDEEGCLSIPGIFKPVTRNWKIVVEYYDENLKQKIKTFSGTTARMIQHEYDHTEGILFIDYLKPLTRRLIESKLKKIKKGNIQLKYPMKFV